MLPAAHRLRDAEDFRTTSRRGSKSSSRSVILHLRLPSDGASREPLVGFVVGKPVGTAVVRNLVKRRLRHLVRERLALLPPGAALVVRARPAAAAASYAELADDVDRALMRLHKEH